MSLLQRCQNKTSFELRDVPVGFLHNSELKRQLQQFILPWNNSLVSTTLDSGGLDTDLSSIPGSIAGLNTSNTDSISSNTATMSIHILHCVDKPSKSLPSQLMLTEYTIRASVRFFILIQLKTILKDLYQDIILLDSFPADAILDVGDLATIKKLHCTTTPVTCPSSFAEVIHMDIVFGPFIFGDDVHYGLFFIDHFSRMIYIYPLQNLRQYSKKTRRIFRSYCYASKTISL
jgi:hypothetical protein